MALKQISLHLFGKYDEFEDFIGKKDSLKIALINKIKTEEKKTVITIQFDRITHELTEDHRLFLKEILADKISDKAKGQLQDILRTKPMVLQGLNGKVIHRKIVKAVRRRA